MTLRRLTGVAAVALLTLPAVAHAAAFDVETATRAYLDTLQGAARAKSDAYFEGGYWLILWGALVSVLVDGLLLGFRIAAKFRDIAERRFKRPFGATWLTALLYSLVGWVITLPWSIYTGFLREKQYGLMNQTFADWSIDALKGLGIDLAIAPLVIAVLYAVIRRFPRNWWLLGTGVFGAFMMFGMMIAPVYIMPLFNTYTELQQGPVRDRIVALAQANHIPAEHIYVSDASRQSKRISANVSGLGPTIRITLNDNLLHRTSLPETAAVMGHEMGHYVLGHGPRNVALLTLMFAVLFFAASRIVPMLIARHGERWQVRDVGDPASMPVFSIVLALIGLITTPVQNTIIRTAESDADAFGLNSAREPDGFALTAMKLSEYRKIEPGKIEEMLFYDHPSGATRVRMSMQWKKDHVPNAQMVTPPPLPQDPPEPK